MARQTHTPAVPQGTTGTTGVAMTETAANATDKERVLATRRIMLIFRNSGSTGRLCTIDNGKAGGVACSFTLGSGAKRVVGPLSARWKQRSGTDQNYITFECAHAE